jgi:predicted PurR-regulated permease PerM
LSSIPEQRSVTREPWGQGTKDAWFFGALALSTIGVVYLFSTFMYVLLFACVVVVVSWPLYQHTLEACKGHRFPAALLTLLALAVLIFGPFTVLVILFVKEAIQLVGTASQYVQSGEITRWIQYVTTSVEWMPDWIQRFLPDDFDLQNTVAGPIQDGALAALNAAGAAAPRLLGGTLGLGLDISIFVFAILSLYMEGPRVLRLIKNLSPMDDAYEDRLFAVFGEFANNLVLGALVTAAVQGFVAGIGYAIVGVDRVVFFAMMTGVCAFVPFVGTMIVLIPLAIAVGVNQGVGPCVFLLVWGIGVAQLDNIIRPLFMRGRTNIHPLLIFLAVFGGISWLGLPGALIGPVMVAGFLALYVIYAEDYLGQAPPELLPSQESPNFFRRLIGRVRRLLEKWGVRKAGEVEAEEPPKHVVASTDATLPDNTEKRLEPGEAS